MIAEGTRPGFDLLKHRAYVDKGYCAALSWCMSYCCQRDGHAGDHWDLRLLPDKSFQIGNRWD